jgi:SagB-type dehydrogenase family enzyme
MAAAPHNPRPTDDNSLPWYVAEGQRGERLLEQGQVEQARAVFEDVLARLGSGTSYTRAVVLGRVARCWQIAGRFDLAEQCVRQALDVTRKLTPTDGVRSLSGTLRSELGDAFRARGEYKEARVAYEAALTIAGELHDRGGEAVELGRLGALAAARGDGHEAFTRFELARRLFQETGDTRQLERCLGALASLLASVAAPDFPELARHAPVIFATLGRLDVAPSYGRAVIVGHLGRCWWTVKRLDLAVASVSEAIGIIAALPVTDDVKGLRAFLQIDLGDMLRAAGRDADARDAYELAFALAADLQDVRGQAVASERLGRTVGERPEHDASSVRITAYDDVAVDHVFDPDLLIEGPRQRRIAQLADEHPRDDLRPMLVPSARTWVDERGAIWFSVPFNEPDVGRDPSCTVLRRYRREVEVRGNPRLVWHLICAMDGANTVTDIVAGIPAGGHIAAVHLLGILAAAGVVDIAGRPLGRFVHLMTKKGVLPGGGLEGDAVLRLATDGHYRAYPDALRIAVRTDVPERLGAFHTLTRSRRSSRDYRGAPVARADFEALLYTACGITGSFAAAGREVPLRAYPSSGALYAVEIYPVVFRVEGLEPAVYHYRASDNVLEMVRPGIDPRVVVRAALPVERDMVGGAAALVCLTGCFPRHERKYGEGGYRMLVAEAGHISQNLILAATALGLRARPFGGLFDDLLNHDLGVDGDDEQFLLAVLVGLV